jgi:PhnB protein
MATDALESTGHTITVGTNFSIAISPENEAEAKYLFNGLSAGGQVTVPFDKAPWGAYFGMLTDKFGIQWMVNYDENPKR